ncbi:MAG: O-antigen ligase domain-containing protein [Cyanobacteria bacterium]|nr:O-antigen ligase domain-containing protein [Cyanobacteriota bacterium]MDW8199633.1 O-antigen ligase domain-containing protein [Cyanobacteriota bacterium SKYGB_h_bin112]
MGGFVIPTNPFGSPNAIAVLVIVAWLPFFIFLFQQYPPRRALVIGIIAAWLFLPEIARSLPGLPDYSKASATIYAALVAIMLFDPGRFSTFKPGLLDIPILVWWFCPFVTSIVNGLGAYDGVSAVIAQTISWGVPYLLGRLYLSNLQGLKDIAVGIFIGGVVYIPFCLFEVRLSPQLHRIVYGAHASGDFSQAIRYGGFRPTVFMSHGLAVGAWMMIATLAGIWLLQSKTLGKKLFYIETKWLVMALSLTFVLLKSTGAYVSLLLGLIIMGTGRFLKTGLLVFVIIIAICVYLYTNTMTESYFTDQLIDYLSNIFPPDRIQSLAYRFNNEEVLVDHARKQILFGWGGWDRSTTIRPEDGKRAVQDSLWIIAFGMNGIVGLVSFLGTMLVPIWAICWKYPARTWMRPDIAPVVFLAVGLLLYTIDCLQNAMLNPTYLLVIGGLTGFAMKPSALKQPAPKPKPKSIQQAAIRGALAVRRSS